MNIICYAMVNERSFIGKNINEKHMKALSANWLLYTISIYSQDILATIQVLAFIFSICLVSIGKNSILKPIKLPNLLFPFSYAPFSLSDSSITCGFRKCLTGVDIANHRSYLQLLSDPDLLLLWTTWYG